MKRVLVIEDHQDLAFGLETALENEGFAVEIAGDGSSGLSRARQSGIDLIVLDLMLPGLDGYRVLRALRGEGIEVPVLVLTAKGEEANKVQAFSIGADDYVTKPFGTLELIARVRALLRRMGRRDEPPIPAIERFGEIEVNPASRTVYRAGQAVSLTPREFDLLLALLKRRGAVGSRADLLRDVWGYQAEVMSRTVDTHLRRLREKLGAGAAWIATVRGVGYRIQDPRSGV